LSYCGYNRPTKLHEQAAVTTGAPDAAVAPDSHNNCINPQLNYPPGFYEGQQSGRDYMTHQIIPVDIENTTILVELSGSAGEREIAGGIHPSFSNVTKAITSVAKEIAGAIESAKPKKASVEFGCDLAIESGQLTALIVKGSGTASLKVTLEWGS